MNNVRATKRINEAELENALRSGSTGASWHDEYKDSAYIFAGGLPHELTEGDVITIFSQFGEILDINMPREKDTGKRRGFGFLMYEDQRSTVLAVDNLNGADILGRTIRVDHVRQYKQKGERGEDGEWKEPEEQSLNAAPRLVAPPSKRAGSDSDDDESDDAGAIDIDPEDPMAAYFAHKRKEGKNRAIGSDHAAEKEAKRQRKEERARKRARKEERRRDRERDEPSRPRDRDRHGDGERDRDADRHRRREDDRHDRDSHRHDDRRREHEARR